MDKRIWLTWETQRRNRELAQAFNCDYCQLDYSNLPRFQRYLKSAFATLNQLAKGYTVIFAQCPSIVLTTIAVLWGTLTRKQVIVDAHNATVESVFSPNPFVRSYYRQILKLSHTVIVSNTALVQQLATCGITNALPLPDKVPHIPAAPTPITKSTRPKIVLIASFAPDEPNKELITAFAETDLDADLYITGRKSKARDLLPLASDRIHFTDFLAAHDFDQLITTADLLIDLTTRENCLVCGAYEAIACGVPAILSDMTANRQTFTKGFLYAANNKASYQAAFQQFLQNATELRQEIQEFRDEFESTWHRYYEQIEAVLHRDLVSMQS